MTKAEDTNTYNLYNELGSLSGLLDDYHKWHFGVLEAALFKGAAGEGSAPQMPSLFIDSLKSLDSATLSIALQKKLANLRVQHEGLVEMAQSICRYGEPISHEVFHDFSKRFRSFISGLQSTCQNLILTEWGLDILTGLHNDRAMYQGLNEELERLSRHGHAFSIVLINIDHYEYMRENMTEKSRHQIVQKIAEYINYSLRSFDDAYYIGKGEFVLSLKQSDIHGGQRALERLQGKLSKSELSFDKEGQSVRVTLSCCVSEPIPEQNIKELIEHLRSDLQSLEKETGAIVTYTETSPLQKFLETRHN